MIDVGYWASKVHWDANNLSWNPSSNEEDTIKACWDGDVDLEVLLI
jgi:hypothetical protein